MTSKALLLSLLMSPMLVNASAKLEPLMGHFINADGIHLQVRSGGCTWKRDFKFTREFVRGRYAISFYRQQEDTCLAYLPYGEVLSFSFEELGLQAGDHFVILNATTTNSVLDD